MLARARGKMQSIFPLLHLVNSHASGRDSEPEVRNAIELGEDRNAERRRWRPG